MNQNEIIKEGKTVSFFGKPYRVLTVTADIVVLIEAGIDRYHFETLALEYLVAADQEKLHEIEDTFVPEHVSITDKHREVIKEKADCIEDILQEIYPEYDRLQSRHAEVDISEYLTKFECSVPTAHKNIRRYLQSGRDMYSLVDQRAIGNTKGRIYDILSEIEKKYFEEAFQNFKNGNMGSVSASYKEMLRKHYSAIELNEDGTVKSVTLVPKEQRPSDKQYRKYVKEQLGNLSVAAFKKGVRERRNADRIRFGTAQTGCRNPGSIVEIDACELDIIILSENNRRNGIGRPIVYFAVDVFSCCIVGYYVGFENNSFLGASSLFANLMFRDNPHRREDGIDITPGGIIPKLIRVDQGSEWISENIRRLGKECGIGVTIVPPAMGSLKGLVENSFHVYQENLRSEGRGYGIIYQEYASRHYETASLMLKDIKKDIEAFVIWFNQDYREGYTLSKEMIEAGVKAVPCELWHYGMKYSGSPISVTESMKPYLLYAMCNLCEKSMKPSISLQGLKVRGLKYISMDPRFISLIEESHFSHKKPEYEVRYDPRLVDYVWVKIGNDILQVPLASKDEAQMSFAGLTWFEYEMLYQDKLERKAEYEQINLENELLLKERTHNTIKKAKAERQLLPGKNEKKNIKEIRKLDQQEERRRTALVNVAGLPEQEALPEPELLLELPEPKRENDGNEKKPKKPEDFFY